MILDPRGIPLTREMMPSRRIGKRPEISLLASRQGFTKKVIKNKTKHTNVSTENENPMDYESCFDKLSCFNVGTNNSTENTNVEATITANSCVNKKLCDTKIADKIVTPKRKLAHENIIESAQKLGKISLSEAKNNLSDKIIITKFMLDRINNYDSLVEANIGKKHKKSYNMISPFGKPNKNLAFSVEKAFEHILCVLFKSCYLDLDSVTNLCATHKLYEHYYVSMYKCLNINFSSLREPDYNWKEQVEVPFIKKMKFLACAFYLNFNIPFMLRYLGGQYTGDDRNVKRILKNIYGNVPSDLFADIKRILTVGAPRFLSGELSRKNFLDYWRYGNHSTMDTEITNLKKVLNKEDKHKYMFSLPFWTTRFIPNLHLSPQGLIQKPGKEDRLVNDASHLRTFDSTCLNMLTNPEKEPEIEYGSAFKDYLTYIYDLRITHPHVDLLTYSDDVSGAFRWPRLNPYIAPSMAYKLLDCINIPAGQVFGNNASAQNFEPIAKARKILAKKLFTDNSLVNKHNTILENVRFCDPPSRDTRFVQSKPCNIRKGCHDENGNLKNPTLFMFVDDSLMCETRTRIMPLLAASIESLFQVMGEDDPEIRRSNLSMEKYYQMECSYTQVQLGIVVDTRKMTVRMTPEKKANLIQVLKAWHTARKCFTIREAGTLLGQLNNAAEVSPWARLLFANIRNSIIVSLRKNRLAVYQNKRFSHFICDSNNTNTDEHSILRKKFALSKIAKEIWNSKIKCSITKSLRAELKLLCFILKSDTFFWETPIAHLIKRTPDFSAWGDSSLEAAGGFSPDLQFFWHLRWPKEIRSKTLKYFKIRTKEKEKIISINLLEYVVIIVNYAIVTDIVQKNNLCEKYPYQTLLNWSDNKTAIVWTKKAAISTESGKALSRIFCTLCINNNINCISEYINTHDNEIADKISRSNQLFANNVKKLMQEHKILQNCKQYQLNPDFVSCLIQALLHGQSPPVGQLPKTGHWYPDNGTM